MKIGLFAVMATALLSAATPFQVRTDISRVPSAAAYAEQCKALCEEWYPRINEILYGTGHPLPYGEIVVLFDPEKIFGRYGQGHGAPAFAIGNTIHISSGWLNGRPSPKDFCGLVIHELAHVNQEYGNFHPRHDHLLALVRPVRIKLSQEYRMSWLVEGIADYVRYKYYEKELQLLLDENTYLRLRNRGYRQGYGVAARFLLWLEERKDEHIVRKLNVVLEQRRYSAGVFKQNCGAPLDSLWQEFLAQAWFGAGK